MAKVEFISVKVPTMSCKFDLYEVLMNGIRDNGEELMDGDVVVISSKFAAMSQGRVVDLAKVKPRPEAKDKAKAYHVSGKMMELVFRESDAIFGGVPGFTLAVKDGILSPNAGIDKSNVEYGYAILYPENPFGLADELRLKVLLHEGKRIGIVLTDSRLMPMRKGTTGIALAVAGFEPIIDDRGRKDLFGNVLKVTQRAIADDICSGAQLLMGESDESTPVVIARFHPSDACKLTDRILESEDLSVNSEECVYVRGFSSVRFGV